MTWLDIQKTYPNGYSKFLNHFADKWIMSVEELGETIKDFQENILYEFFDSTGILVTLYHFDMGEFVPLINMYETYGNDNKIATEGHIEIVFDGQHEGLIFDTRKEAEICGFKNAFEILESRI
jgi:hypothetical protein